MSFVFVTLILKVSFLPTSRHLPSSFTQALLLYLRTGGPFVISRSCYGNGIEKWDAKKTTKKKKKRGSFRFFLIKLLRYQRFPSVSLYFLSPSLSFSLSIIDQKYTISFYLGIEFCYQSLFLPSFSWGITYTENWTRSIKSFIHVTSKYSFNNKKKVYL